jgi:hypothetical protein
MPPQSLTKTRHSDGENPTEIPIPCRVQVNLR